MGVDKGAPAVGTHAQRLRAVSVCRESEVFSVVGEHVCRERSARKVGLDLILGILRHEWS